MIDIKKNIHLTKLASRKLLILGALNFLVLGLFNINIIKVVMPRHKFKLADN